MQIKNTLESLSISTDDAAIFGEIREIMYKNFASTLHSKGKVISFYDKNELVQRRYFLKFIRKIAIKHTGVEPKLNFAEHKTLKLSYKAQNSLSQLLFIDIDFIAQDVIFTLNSAPKIFANYLKKVFKGSKAKYNENTNTLSMRFSSQDEFDALDELISKKEHIKFSINFRYENSKLQKAKSRVNSNKSGSFTRCFYALASILENEFKILGCDINSDFESVRAAYLKMVKMYHPDRHMQKSERIKSEYREHFEKVQHAWETLKPFFKKQESFASA
ncbi:adenylosuccinate lyase [Campylobacter sp. 19-13652]|uniref:adenylosuccinate lyase n=1 Tax=Campylobacter sp. 19-13652 TaxID=2840180 RepID=UPI001C770C7D|nr:adenylosuccinate lyase [Campylobacter sp. 19-13652]BCX79678.1 adenylosuccinate lyase [Campylobacter sp. 19-13652]